MGIVNALDISLLVVDSISLLITFPGYMFIVVVNILDWMKNKRLDISDQLICGLGLLSLSNRIYQVSYRCTILMHGFQIITGLGWLSSHLTYMSTNFCTLLFSTWLAIHFCLKIVNINRNLYIYIQRMFPKMFPWILLPSVFASLLISAPAAHTMSKLNSNSTDSRCSPLNVFLSLQLYYVFYAFCFLIFFIPVVVTILSLYRHMQRLQNHSSNFRAETVEAHVTAVKTLIFLLVLNLLQFILPILMIVTTKELQWMNTILLVFAICHTLDLPILIRGSRKLQKKLQKMWLYCTTLIS